MALLFITWIFVRNLLYAALQANVIWAAARAAVAPLSWLEVWWGLSTLHFVINSPRILRANEFKFFLPVDVGLFAVALGSGAISGSILTALLEAIIWLTKSWTGFEPDWLLLWLGTVSVAVLLWRSWVKHKGRKAWEGAPGAAKEAPKKVQEKKDYSFGQQSPDLPQWQLDTLAEHRRQRTSLRTNPNQIVWTRTPTGSAVTEFGNHWAQVARESRGEFGFGAYSKDSGAMTAFRFDYDTEEKAINAAADFLRSGKDPRSIG